MEQSQLIELIRTLLPQEKEQVLQFASLQFINTGKMRAQVIPLLKICLSHPWEDPNLELNNKQVFSVIFPGQDFIEGKLEKVRVEAHKIVRTFLSVQQYLREGNEFDQVLDLSESVKLKGLEIRYQHLLSKLQKMQAEYAWKNETYFHRQFLLEYAKHNEESRHNRLKGDLNVPAVIQTLENYAHLHRLALLNRFLLQQKVAKLDVPETIKTFLEENNVPLRCLEASASLRVNYLIFKLLSKDFLEPSDVRSLFDLLLLNEKEIDPDNLRGFYTYLRNLCVLIYNSDAQNEEINFTLHELYKDNLNRGYLHYKGKLHSVTYLGVCNNAIWVKNHDWALEFIEKYKKDLIDENETQDFYRFNLANYLFAIGRFDDCLDHIPDTSTSVVYLLQGKRLELKTLYELQSDQFSYKLDSFKMFLIRTSTKLLSDNQRQIHVDFANLLNQIINSLPGDHKRSELLVKRIQGKKQAAEWRWLLEKAKALKGVD
ncbi:MAG: hypothetical protein ACKVT2_20860 [Saprospiraceae bacterium]